MRRPTVKVPGMPDYQSSPESKYETLTTKNTIIYNTSVTQGV